jgi:hypothetical protein
VDARDTRALAAIWVETLMLAVLPFARVGASDSSGNRYYRAYFTADFVWHAALTSELDKFSAPPRNRISRTPNPLLLDVFPAAGRRRGDRAASRWPASRRI